VYQILTTMKEFNVDIFGFAELNRSLSRGYKNEWTDITRKLFYYSRSVHSESNVQLESSYKQGGTMTTITGKWQSRITQQGQDKKGLGRWSYMKVSSNKALIIFITAYRPCATYGPNTAWIQQWALLRELGQKNPDPIQHFYHDLEIQLQEWLKQGSEIVLMIDANEHVGDKPGGITSIMGRLGMTELIRHLHPNSLEPNTHIRGSQPIDYIFGTAKVRENSVEAGILPFGMGYHSDHRAIFVSIQMEKILTTKVQSSDSITARKLQQATPKERDIFIQEAHRYLDNQNIYNRLCKLQSTDEAWTEEDKTNMNSVIRHLSMAC
jgi:hypothetical protein